MDPRIKKLARVLLHYSLKLKKGQLLRIQGELVGLPLMNAAFEEAVDMGANPFLKLRIPEQEEYFLKHAGDDQLKYLNPVNRYETEKIDAVLHIWASQNTRYLSGVDPRKQALAMKTLRPVRDRFYKRVNEKTLSWVGTQFPTHADAQEADMSLEDYREFVFKAGHLNSTDPVKHWKKVAREQDRLAKILNRFDKIHVQSKDTDLKLRVKGRKWINCAGTENFPDGEIFTGPLEDTAEGVIRYSFPAIYMGHEVEDVRLEFRKGRVIKESAGKNVEFLSKMLDTDKGARYIGEFAIGTNYEIKQFSKNILFDEKIGGTCHLALGASILESGGKNKSSIHWDMICDLKGDSQITADGKIIYRNGKFTI